LKKFRRYQIGKGDAGSSYYYWEQQHQTDKEFVLDTSAVLANLSGYTHYMLTLTAFNMAGDGPPSEPRGARTQQSAPSPPGFLT
ncbi:hypothetical protein NHX12_017926, partial [Muraenolepis orangiensis]